MSLLQTKSFFKNKLELAFLNQLNNSVLENANSDEIIEKLCSDITDAIVEYVKSAEVKTQDTIYPGQTATSLYGLGIYSSVGSASGTGIINVQNEDILRSDLISAYKKSKNNSLSDTPVSIIETLSYDIANSIKKFLLSCTVSTNVLVNGGVPVTGYLSPAGLPLTSVSAQHSGKGVGTLQ